jgi:hypothetical protein
LWDRLAEFSVDSGHSEEVASVCSDSFRRFMAMSGVRPSKFVEGGLTSRFGAWAGIRYWPTAAPPHGDFDNPVWQITRLYTDGKVRLRGV